MKKHNTFKVVLITILVLLLLTWIFPAAYYSGEVVDQGRVQMGLQELFSYPLTAVSYFGHIAVFIILVGGFYGVLYKIPAYRTFLDKFVKKFEGKEKVLLAIISIIIALCVSVAGLQLGLIIFIPLFVSLILLMGYDKIVSALIIVGSLSVGIIGSTYSSSLTSLESTLSLDINYQIGVRFIILLVGIVLVLFNAFMYIKLSLSKKKISNLKESVKDAVEEIKKEEKPKTTTKKTTYNTSSKKSTKSKSTKATKSSSGRGRPSKNANKAALRDEDIIVIKESIVGDSDSTSYLVPKRVESSHKIWPFITFFSLLFILVVLAFIPWGEGGFGVKFFDDITTKFNEFQLFGFPIFAKVYGSVGAFGTWTIIDLFLPLFLVLLLLVIIYKVKLDEVFDGFISGATKALKPAAIEVLLYTVLVITTYNPFQLTIYKAILGLAEGFNVATTVAVTFLSSIFNVESAYTFQAVLPYYTSVVTNSESYQLVGIISQSMFGLASLFVPSSFVLMLSLSYLNISYKEWLKNSWKLLLELFVILLIIFIILALL